MGDNHGWNENPAGVKEEIATGRGYHLREVTNSGNLKQEQRIKKKRQLQVIITIRNS